MRLGAAVMSLFLGPEMLDVPRSHSWCVVELGFEMRPIWLQSPLSSYSSCPRTVPQRPSEIMHEDFFWKRIDYHMDIGQYNFLSPMIIGILTKKGTPSPSSLSPMPRWGLPFLFPLIPGCAGLAFTDTLLGQPLRLLVVWLPHIKPLVGLIRCILCLSSLCSHLSYAFPAALGSR